jgi:hypothetical protein
MITTANSKIFFEKVYSAIVHYFIHFYFITVFEIIFYKYYIFEYEKSVVFNMIDSTINEYLPNGRGINHNFLDVANITFTTTNITTISKNCDNFVGNSEFSIDKNNTHLFHICDIYIYTISSVLFLISLYDLSIVINLFRHSHRCAFETTRCSNTTTILENQSEYQTRKDTIIYGTSSKSPINNDQFHSLVLVSVSDESSRNSQELQKIQTQNSEPESEPKNSQLQNSESESESESEPESRPHSHSIDIDNSSEIQIKRQYITNFIYFYICNSKFFLELNKVCVFITCLGLFEYLFFTYIVCEFRFLDLGQIICSIFKYKIKNGHE